MRKEKYMYKNDVYKSFKKKTKHHDSKQKNNHSLLTLITKLGITAQKMFKAPVFWIIISLILVILVLPSLIVNPFSKSVHKQIANESQTEQLRIETIDDDLALSVAVMRTESEKVEQIPLETYVSRVVASEMPAEFELEALKAQALAARTYIVNYLLHHDALEEVTDSTEHQVYQNEEELQRQWGSDYAWKMEKINEATLATKGEILTYEDQPITPAYFSTSNGYTENSEDYWEQEIPYLRSVASPWDETSPRYIEQHIFTVQEVSDALKVPLQKNSYIPMDITRTDSQRVKQLTIGDQTFSGREVREKLHLPSNDFSIEQKDDHLIFTTRGYGHGVGMSQYGANGMAEEGKSYEEIVSYFYKDIAIDALQQVVPSLVAK